MSTTATILQIVLQYSRAAFGFCQIGETRFEFVVDEKLLYSKLMTHRHAEQGEVAGLLRKYLKGGGG